MFFERLKLNNLIYYLFTFALFVRHMTCDMCLSHCVLRFVSSRILCFPFSGDDTVTDQYDYMGYGSKYEDYDDDE